MKEIHHNNQGNINNIDLPSLLNEAVNQGIINIENVHRQIEMKNKVKYLQKHPYKIYSGKDNQWYTYLPDEKTKGGRKKLKKHTREEIENLVVNYYKKQEEEELKSGITLRDVYPMWIRYKAAHTESTTTIRRWNNDWKKFYEKDSQEIIDKPIKSLTVEELDIWIHTLIKKHQMTKKCYYTMSIIIRQGLDYCVEHLGIISENPFRKVVINKKMLRKNPKKSDETQVFMTDETPKIIQSAIKDFQRNPMSTAPLAVILDYLTGFRIGEMSAVREEDIIGNMIRIQRRESETYDCTDLNHIKLIARPVIDGAKTEAGMREVPLIPQAKKLLEFVIAYNKEQGWYDNGYIFMKKGKRITIRSLRYHIDKYCRENNIEPKSFHKIRKTYISSLIDQGVNINEIRKAVGHADERTTFSSYCYNRRMGEETFHQFENALITNNGLGMDTLLIG